MRLIWSLQAENDHEAIVEHIFTENMTAAIKIGDRIKDTAHALKDFPEMGREGRFAGTRELTMPIDQCVAVYRINGDIVEILRLFHGGQRWPDEL